MNAIHTDTIATGLSTQLEKNVDLVRRDTLSSTVPLSAKGSFPYADGWLQKRPVAAMATVLSTVAAGGGAGVFDCQSALPNTLSPRFDDIGVAALAQPVLGNPVVAQFSRQFLIPEWAPWVQHVYKVVFENFRDFHVDFSTVFDEIYDRSVLKISVDTGGHLSVKDQIDRETALHEKLATWPNAVNLMKDVLISVT